MESVSNEFFEYLKHSVVAPAELDESGMPWGERLVGFRLENNKCILRVFSDGFSLAQKVTVEKYLKQVATQWSENGQKEVAAERINFLAGFQIFMERKDKSGATARPGVAASQGAHSSHGAHSSQSAHSSQASSSSQQPKTDVNNHRTLGSAQNPFNQKAIPGVKHIIAVASGKGGVGKSTISVNLALALRNQGYKVGLLDADIYGPSQPMMLGIRKDPSVNANNKIEPPEAHGLKVMSFGFFAADDSAVIWRGPMVMKALQQFFYDVEWGELDFLVIDLPPGTGDAQLTLVQSLPISGAVIVTTPQNVALLDAVKGVVMFRKTDVPILGVIENMTTFVCPSCGAESSIFGTGGAEKMSEKYEVPLLGNVPLVSELRAAGDDGKPLTTIPGHPMRVRFAEIADNVTLRLAQLQNKKQQSSFEKSHSH